MYSCYSLFKLLFRDRILLPCTLYIHVLRVFSVDSLIECRTMYHCDLTHSRKASDSRVNLMLGFEGGQDEMNSDQIEFSSTDRYCIETY